MSFIFYSLKQTTVEVCNENSIVHVINKCTLKDDFWSCFMESENQLNTLGKKKSFLYGFVHVWYFVKGVKGLSMPHYFCTSIVNICIVFFWYLFCIHFPCGNDGMIMNSTSTALD